MLAIPTKLNHFLKFVGVVCACCLVFSEWFECRVREQDPNAFVKLSLAQLHERFLQCASALCILATVAQQQLFAS
jgi:hypothetical protein